MKTDVSISATRVKKSLRANDIRHDKRCRILDRPVNMRLGREVYDSLNLLHEVLNKISVANIAFDKCQAWIISHGREIFDISRVRQLVEHDEFILWMRGEDVVDEVCTNKTGSTGHEEFHATISTHTTASRQDASVFSFFAREHAVSFEQCVAHKILKQTHVLCHLRFVEIR